MFIVRLSLAAALAISAVSCANTSADLKYPTVAEADDFDVANGLPRRKPRGGPKQIYKYNASEAAAISAAQGASAPAPSAPSAPMPAPAAPAPAPAPAAQPSVTVPPNLR